MYGVVTRNRPETEWAEFDRADYEVKDVTGRAAEPVEGATNMVSCFGDTAAVEADPSLAAVDADGTPATPEQPYFDWAFVCPTNEDYRRGVLETVEDCADASPDVRLDDVGFPRQGYCRCSRCQAQFEASDRDRWTTWRADVVGEFLEAAAERVPGRLSLTVYPDPFPGHLVERSGVDLDALADVVDEVVVPLYDTHYGTTYWLEALASGFADRLECPLAVELYAVDVEVDALVDAARVAAAYADTVLFGYDAANARAAVRRLAADEREGETHG